MNLPALVELDPALAVTMRVTGDRPGSQAFIWHRSGPDGYSPLRLGTPEQPIQPNQIPAWAKQVVYQGTPLLDSDGQPVLNRFNKTETDAGDPPAPTHKVRHPALANTRGSLTFPLFLQKGVPTGYDATTGQTYLGLQANLKLDYPNLSQAQTPEDLTTFRYRVTNLIPVSLEEIQQQRGFRLPSRSEFSQRMRALTGMNDLL